MLVKIYKGDKSLLIPYGAYKHQYAPSGWILSKDFRVTDSQPDETVSDEKEHETEYENEDENDTSESSVIEDLEERPLSELSIPELRALAEHKGIDITGITSAKKLRDAIKSSN